MAKKATITTLIKPASDPAAQDNFARIKTVLAELCPVCHGKATELVTLAAGDNSVRPSVPRPIGRITTYIDGAVVLYDKGLNSNGQWVVNSSNACKARFIFF